MMIVIAAFQHYMFGDIMFVWHNDGVACIHWNAVGSVDTTVYSKQTLIVYVRRQFSFVVGFRNRKQKVGYPYIQMDPSLTLGLR